MKFSIRDLLLVTLIVALSMAWWLDRTRLAKETQHLETRIKYYEASADAVRSLANAQAVYNSARAKWERDLTDQTTETWPTTEETRLTTEGPVRGYNLLGPPPSQP